MNAKLVVPLQRQRDVAEDNLLLSSYGELSRVHSNLEEQNYSELIRTYHMVSSLHCCSILHRKLSFAFVINLIFE